MIDRLSKDLDLRFDAPEPEGPAGQLRQVECFGWLLGLGVGTLHFKHMTGLTQDEQAVVTLGSNTEGININPPSET